MVLPVGGDEGQRLDRNRVEVVVAEVPRQVPAGGHHQADDDAGEDIVEALPECGLGQRERDEAAAQQHGHDRSHRVGTLQAERRGEQRPQTLVVEVVEVELDVGGLEDADARQSEQSAQRRVRGDAEHQQDHQGLEAPAAEANEVALPAARAERHAHAERDASDDVAEPPEVRREVDGAVEVHQARAVEPLRAEDREAGGEEPCAETPARAHVEHVAHRAHRAEVGAVGDEAEHCREHEAPRGHEVHDREFELFHPCTLPADRRPGHRVTRGDAGNEPDGDALAVRVCSCAVRVWRYAHARVRVSRGYDTFPRPGLSTAPGFVYKKAATSAQGRFTLPGGKAPLPVGEGFGVMGGGPATSGA